VTSRGRSIVELGAALDSAVFGNVPSQLLDDVVEEAVHGRLGELAFVVDQELAADSWDARHEST
jgi:hypothetical protein